MTASMHGTASMSSFCLQELGTGESPDDTAKVSRSVDKEGDASLLKGLGHGVDSVETKLIQVHVQMPTKSREWPNPRHEKYCATVD